MSHYESCEARYGNYDTLELLQCMSKSIEDASKLKDTNAIDFMLILAGAMVFFMQTGFAMLCAGAVRQKNVQNTMLKNLLDACGAALAFYFVGYAFAFGGDMDVDSDNSSDRTFLGSKNFASIGPAPSFWFFQYTFSAASVTIVAGTLAERCQMAAYLCYSVFLAGFVYPVVAHSIWSKAGFLSATVDGPLLGIGSIDFAGSGVVHLTGGATALVATLILGPRKGRFYDPTGAPLEAPRDFPGHSIALQLLGTMILWFGWFGFNPGSALVLGSDYWGELAAIAAVNTALSGATGGIVALFTHLFIVERRTGEPEFSIVHAMNGSLSGCVAITSCCGIVEPYSAVVIGCIAGWIYVGTSPLLVRLKIDDAVDAIPVHMCNGIWGMLSTGLLAEPTLMEKAYGTGDYPGLFYGSGNLFGCQITAITFILAWVVVTMLPFFIWLNCKGWLRAEPLEEIVGLDISYHGSVVDGSNGGAIRKEYLEAFNRQRLLKNKQRNSTIEGSSQSSIEKYEAICLSLSHHQNGDISSRLGGRRSYDRSYGRSSSGGDGVDSIEFRNTVSNSILSLDSQVSESANVSYEPKPPAVSASTAINNNNNNKNDNDDHDHQNDATIMVNNSHQSSTLRLAQQLLNGASNNVQNNIDDDDNHNDATPPDHASIPQQQQP